MSAPYFQKAEFSGSFAKLSDCPKDEIPEFAFIGRSNVGKSSLINLLCNNKYLAKTSSTPGKTQTLNFFKINEKFYLVDLPGFGYARVGKQLRAAFSKLISYYLKNSKHLVCTYILIDISIPPQKLDIEMINFLGAHLIPFRIIFTKSDRINRSDKNLALENYKKALISKWDVFPEFLSTSVKNKEGSDIIITDINNILSNLKIKNK